MQQLAARPHPNHHGRRRVAGANQDTIRIGVYQAHAKARQRIANRHPVQ